MIKLLVGHKGTGKTKIMVEMANRDVTEKDGSVVFIIKDDRLKHDLDINIRMIVMDDYEYVNNIDEYIGFLYGMYSSNHDIEYVFIDGILKHADISLDNIPAFIDRLKQVSKECEVEFYVSISANKEELADVNTEGCKYLN